MPNAEYHFAPDFLNLLVDTIPRLSRSKKDVLLFFRGAGVSNRFLDDLTADLQRDKDSHNKYDLARAVIIRLNEDGDASLAARREVVRRIVEFEDFTRCWDTDTLAAKGLVSEVRRLVDVKDSFTRINQERERERSQVRAAHNAEAKARLAHNERVEEIKRALFALFADDNPHRRGKALEPVLNRLFDVHGVLIREAFTVRVDKAGVVEQIDGAIEIDGHLYIVEMKWWNEPLGPGQTAQHLVRVFSRDGARGIFISATGYTQASIQQYREALQQRTVVLMTLEEIVETLNDDGDVSDLLRTKIRKAVLDKDPLVKRR